MSVGADGGAVGYMGEVGNMGEVERCWRAQVKILGGGSCVRWISCELGVRGVVAGRRRRRCIFQTFQNLRQEVDRGTVHEVVARELRSRDFVNVSINCLVGCASESNRAHVIV